jgi:predicted alpha/beta-hydrolase family hydrolase
MSPDLIFDGPQDAAATVVLTHGAGAGMDTPFMETFAQGLAAQNLRVGRFEFPYMKMVRETGRRRPPDRAPILLQAWEEVIDSLDAKPLLIGGKSLGGRIASMVADKKQVTGLICLGYPFHPPGKPDRLRTEHLRTLETPTLICQGSRDPFGTAEEVAQYDLPAGIRLHWLGDGDHSFNPRKRSGRSIEQNWQEAIEAVVNFINDINDLDR